MWDKFKRFQIGILLTLAIVIGGATGIYGTKHFAPTYAPISYVSVGVVQNTVPGTDGAALYAGGELEYTHALCLNQTEAKRVKVTWRYRQYEPVSKPPIIDPLLDHLELIIPPGCERPDTKQILPAFITPGVWALEVDIEAKSGGEHQNVQLVTTRFTVLPKP